MKKAIRIVCILLLFTLLFGCTGPSKYSYEIRNVDGVNHLFIEGVERGNVPNGVNPDLSLHFDTNEDFVDTLRNGKFTEEEWEILKFTIRALGKCLVPDLDHLPEPFGLEGSQLDYIVWSCSSGELTYKFSMADDIGSANISTMDKAGFQFFWNESAFQEKYADTLVEVVTDSERNATIYYYRSYPGARYMEMRAYFTFETENGVYYVSATKSYDAKIGDSPNYISVYHQISDDQYVHTYFTGCDRWLSNEILSSFGLRFPE